MALWDHFSQISIKDIDNILYYAFLFWSLETASSLILCQLHSQKKNPYSFKKRFFLINHTIANLKFVEIYSNFDEKVWQTYLSDFIKFTKISVNSNKFEIYNWKELVKIAICILFSVRNVIYQNQTFKFNGLFNIDIWNSRLKKPPRPEFNY